MVKLMIPGLLIFATLVVGVQYSGECHIENKLEAASIHAEPVEANSLTIGDFSSSSITAEKVYCKSLTVATLRANGEEIVILGKVVVEGELSQSEQKQANKSDKEASEGESLIQESAVKSKPESVAQESTRQDRKKSGQDLISEPRFQSFLFDTASMENELNRLGAFASFIEISETPMTDSPQWADNGMHIFSEETFEESHFGKTCTVKKLAIATHRLHHQLRLSTNFHFLGNQWNGEAGFVSVDGGVAWTESFEAPNFSGKCAESQHTSPVIATVPHDREVVDVVFGACIETNSCLVGGRERSKFQIDAILLEIK